MTSIYQDSEVNIRQNMELKKLVYLEEHEDYEVASKREKQIQGWTREKKEKLISGEWKKEW